MNSLNLNIFSYGGEYYNGNNDFVVVDGGVNDEENEKLSKQIESALSLDFELISQILKEYCFIFQEKSERRNKIVEQVDKINTGVLK